MSQASSAPNEPTPLHGMPLLLGTVSLDAGAVDVVKQMPNVYPFLKTRYREAFGDTEAQWVTASPYHRLDRSAAPWLGVCSTTRKDDPCGQARAYVAKSRGLGVMADMLTEGAGDMDANAFKERLQTLNMSLGFGADWDGVGMTLTTLTENRDAAFEMARLALMQPNSYIVNTARGDIIDEDALIQALRAGKIAGAGLDVFENEPAVNPKLVKLANEGKVVLLPHTGSATIEGRIDMGEKVIINIRTYFDGHRPPNRVLPNRN